MGKLSPKTLLTRKKINLDLPKDIVIIIYHHSWQTIENC